MEQDWYFERRNVARHMAPIFLITQNFEYLLGQAREALRAGEAVLVHPAASASSGQLDALAAAGPVDIRR